MCKVILFEIKLEFLSTSVSPKKKKYKHFKVEILKKKYKIEGIFFVKFIMIKFSKK